MSRTLLLDRTVWDLCKDAAANIAVASEPYSTAQDVASALLTFLGECWYNTADGIPYMQVILGRPFPAATFKAQAVKAALSVPGVVKASCTILALTARDLSAQVLVTLGSGVSFSVTLGGGSASVAVPVINFDFSKAANSGWATRV